MNKKEVRKVLEKFLRIYENDAEFECVDSSDEINIQWTHEALS